MRAMNGCSREPRWRGSRETRCRATHDFTQRCTHGARTILAGSATAAAESGLACGTGKTHIRTPVTVITSAAQATSTGTCHSYLSAVGTLRHSDEKIGRSRYPPDCCISTPIPHLSAGRPPRLCPNRASRSMFHVKHGELARISVRVSRVVCVAPRFSFPIALSAGKLVSVGRQRRCHGGCGCHSGAGSVRSVGLLGPRSSIVFGSGTAVEDTATASAGRTWSEFSG